MTKKLIATVIALTTTLGILFALWACEITNEATKSTTAPTTSTSEDASLTTHVCEWNYDDHFPTCEKCGKIATKANFEASQMCGILVSYENSSHHAIILVDGEYKVFETTFSLIIREGYFVTFSFDGNVITDLTELVLVVDKYRMVNKKMLGDAKDIPKLIVDEIKFEDGCTTITFKQSSDVPKTSINLQNYIVYDLRNQEVSTLSIGERILYFTPDGSDTTAILII